MDGSFANLWAFLRNSNSRQVLAALAVDINKLAIEANDFNSSRNLAVRLGIWAPHDRCWNQGVHHRAADLDTAGSLYLVPRRKRS